MKTILVDDNQYDLELLKEECANIPGVRILGTFDNAKNALAYAERNPVDFALLDIEMPEMNGITLAGKLKEVNPDIIIIFVTAYSHFALDALKIKADYFVIKPYERADVLDAIRRAKLLVKKRSKDVLIRTFGRFDIFVDERIVKFSNAKSKELLALCVDHMGGQVSMGEAIDKLWEDKDYDNRAKALYRKAIICANATLKEYDITEIFTHSRGSCCVVPEYFRCDYYEYLKNPLRTNLYQNEYMFEYSWAETTNARLSFEINERN